MMTMTKRVDGVDDDTLDDVDDVGDGERAVEDKQMSDDGAGDGDDNAKDNVVT